MFVRPIITFYLKKFHLFRERMERNFKIMLFWILGAILIMLGSMISGSLEKGLGVSDSGFLLALAISFILFLLGGLLWISVAIATKTIRDEE